MCQLPQHKRYSRNFKGQLLTLVLDSFFKFKDFPGQYASSPWVCEQLETPVSNRWYSTLHGHVDIVLKLTDF